MMEHFGCLGNADYERPKHVFLTQVIISNNFFFIVSSFLAQYSIFYTLMNSA